MLKGSLAKRGYDWWWHSFTGYHKETGEEKAFFIEYFIVNPSLGQDEPVLGQKNQGDKLTPPSYVMVKAGAWGKGAKQIHEFYPISELRMDTHQLNLTVGKCHLTEEEMKGEVEVSAETSVAHPEYMCDAGSMKWDLKIHKKVAFHVGYGASRFFRWLNAFEMFWHAEGMKTEYEGTVIYEGETYKIIGDKSYGYADKNWGKDFTSPWVWISSWNMESLLTHKKLNNSVIDIGGGRPKVFGVPLPRRLLMALYYEGKDYEFNFSKFWTRTKTTFECEETEDEIVWCIETENKEAAMKVTCRCLKTEMLLINYEAPDGAKRHNRLWNGGTGQGEIYLYQKKKGSRELIDHIAFKNAGCEYGEYERE